METQTPVRLGDLDAFTRAYVEAALWSSIDDNDVPLDRDHDASNITPAALARAAADCARFQLENRDALDAAEITDASAGHDLWLTRCGHGAGYWDRDLGEVGEVLTRAAHAFGERWLYVADDGTIDGF